MKVRSIQFTHEGYQKLRDDFEKYTVKRKETVVRLRTAREMGDLSENGAYKAARFELGGIDRELRRLTYLLRVGRVTENISGSTIGFGSKVTLESKGKQMTFTLVSGYESNPAEGKLSVGSPIGKAIEGRTVGTTVTVSTPSGKTTYTVVSVE